MSRTIKAIYEDGVLKPLEPLHLPEHTETRVTVEEETPALESLPEEEGLAVLRRKFPFVASGDSGRSDIAERHEEILREEWGLYGKK
ncbi:MAG: antitoxin family protein [Bdellovibrionota bacterium]